jgi:hypothetical protein
LILGWRIQSFYFPNNFSLDSWLGMMRYSQELGLEVLVVNIYGLYMGILYLWDKFFNLYLLGNPHLIVGRNMIFLLLSRIQISRGIMSLQIKFLITLFIN